METETQSTVSACENTAARRPLNVCYQVASGPQKIHKMTPQQRQTQFGNQWYVVQTTAGGPNTTPARQHSELGQAQRARMEYDSTQRATGS